MCFINTNASEEPLQYICQGQINKYTVFTKADRIKAKSAVQSNEYECELSHLCLSCQDQPFVQWGHLTCIGIYLKLHTSPQPARIADSDVLCDSK